MNTPSRRSSSEPCRVATSGRRWIAAAATAVMLAALPNFARAQCPPQWLPGDGFDLRGGAASDGVNALAEMPNGDLIAGGVISVAGGVAVSNIARWNGSVWAPLGSGIQGGAVRALAVLSNGDLVAGGDFTTAGGVAVNKIARWNGTTWSSLGAGMTGSATPQVLALAALPNGDLVAGGSFTASGGVSAKNVARWNGSAWVAMGGGVFHPAGPFGPGPELEVTALTVRPGGSIVAGTSTIGLGASGFVTEWNGASWTTFGVAGSLSGGGAFHALANLPNGDLVAGGAFPWIGSFLTTGGVAQWNGSTWSSLGSGLWSGGFSNPVARALTVLGNGDLIAAGSFSTAGGVPVASIARWDGSAWASIGGAGGAALLTMTNGVMVEGGMFTQTSAAGSHLIARWGCDAGIARSSTFGTGCNWFAPSFYENLAAPQSFDLSSSTLQLSLTPTGYDVVHVPGAPNFFTPPATSTPLALADDSVSALIPLGFSIPYPGGSTTDIVVGSNGCVFWQLPFAAAPYYGQMMLFLNDVARHAVMWGDLDPASGSGAGTIHVDIVGQTVYVTWLAVQEWNQPGVVSTFQIALSANGNVEYRYLACDHLAEVLTGWTPANGALDPTSRDLSTSGPFSTTSASFQLPLQHTVDHRPWLGGAVTLTTSGLPATSVLGLNLVGFTKYQPGIELSSIGMPGCHLFTSLDLLFPFFPVAQSGSLSIAIPNQTNLIGFQLHTQGTAWDFPANAAGMIVSNGLTLTLGTL